MPTAPTALATSHDLFAGLAQAPTGYGVATRSVRCEECGAEVSFTAELTATKCSFCGSAKVLNQEASANTISPEWLLPFGVDKSRASQAFGTWLTKLWFRPSDLKQLATVQEVGGVYVPFWTYNAHAQSDWTADRGHHYNVDEEHSEEENGRTVTRTRRVQKTRWEAAAGNRDDDYVDILVCASRGLPSDLVLEIKTFDTQQLVAYQPQYLAGWSAERYAIDLKAGWETAKSHIEAEQENRCGKDVGGDTHRDLVVQSRLSDLRYKHVLLPVWIAAYRYRQKVYRFLVNGQTGEVVGKAPFSVAKITLFVLFVAALIAALVLLFSQHQTPQH